jgi:hypothetical protein
MKPEDVRKLLEIDRESLDMDLVGQPDLVYQVGMAQAKAISERDGQKDKLKLVEAGSSFRARSSLEKITEKAVQEAVELDSDVLRARDLLGKLTEEARQWEVCCDAVRSRGYAIHRLCDFVLTEGAAIVGQSERERRQEKSDSEVQDSMKTNPRRRRRVVEEKLKFS